jgi:autotransporter-associated beta strand protein
MLKGHNLLAGLKRFSSRHSAETDPAIKKHRSVRLREAAAASLESLESRILFSWIGATSGTTNDSAHTYNNTANWAGGVIDDSFSGVNFTANTTLYLNASRTTASSGLNLNYNGNYNVSLQSSSSTAQTLTINGGVTDSVGGYTRTITLGNASNALNLNLNSSTQTFNVASGDTVVSLNPISAGGLTKTGAGTLVLEAADSYGSGTTVSAGVLQIGAATATNALPGSGTVVDNAGIAFDITGSQTIGSVITGTGTVQQIGSGTVTLGGANTYSGNTTITAGVLKLGIANALQNSTVVNNVANGLAFSGGITYFTVGGLSGTTGLVLTDSNTGGVTLTEGGNGATASYTGILSGSGSLKVAGGVETLSGANTLSGGVAVIGGQLNINSAGALGSGTFTASGGTIDNTSGSSITESNNNAQNWGGNVTFLGSNPLNFGTGAVTLTAASTVTVSAGNLTVGGVIGGAYGLTKAGAGTITLSGASTFSGGLNLSAGQLNVNSAKALGTGALTISGGTIDNTSGSAVTESNNNTQYWNSDFTFIGSSALNLGTGGVTLSASRTITVSGSSLTVGGVIGGAFGITKVGGGTLTLGGANSYSGTTNVNAGTLQLGNSNASQNSTVVVGVANGLTFSAGIGNFTVGGLSGSVNESLTDTGGSPVTLTVGNNGSVNSYSGVLSGTGSLRVVTGTESLTAANTFSGGVAVSSGQLNIGNAAALGTGTLNLSGGSIDNTTGAALTDSNNNAQSWGGSFSFVGSNPLNLGTGAVTLRASTTVTTSASSLTIGGNVGGAFGLTKAGGGTLTLSGANTYSGGLNLSAGQLNINSAGALGTGTFTVAGGSIDNSSGAAITDGNNNAQTWSGNFTFVGSNALNLGSGAVTLSAGRTVTTTAGNLSIGGVISGAYSITKVGAGTLTLSGADTFTGGTTLSAGQLNINNAKALGTGTFTVSGGTIDNTSGAAITDSNNNAQAWNGDFSFVGSSALNLGTGAVSLGANRGVTVSAGTLTEGGVISGAYGITKAGAGALSLGGADSYSGTTSVNAGAVQLANSNALQNSTVSVGVNGGLVFASGISNFTIGGLSGSGNEVLSDTASSPVVLSVGNNGSTNLYSGILSGAGGLKILTGTQTLSGANTFTGGVTLVSGQLNVNSATALGTGTFNLSGGSIDNTSGAGITESSGNAQIWNGNFTFVGSNVLNLGTGNVTLTGNRTITTTASSLIVGGVVAGGYGLTKSGSGTLVLAGADTYSGATSIGAGSIQLGNAAAVQNSTVSVGVSGGLTFGPGIGSFTLGGLAGTGGLSLSDTGSSAVSITEGGNGSTTSYSGILSGSGSLNIVGGVESLTAANTFSGGVTLSSGQLNINNASALGTGTFNIAGGSIDNSSGAAITESSNNAQVWAGNFTFIGSSALNLGIGGVTLSGARSVTTSANNLTIGGSIAGGFGLTKAGSGTLTLSGNNTFNGGLNLSTGEINLNSPTALGSGLFTVSGGWIDNTSGEAITESNNNPQTWGGNFSFVGSNALNLGTGAVSLTSARSVTVAGSNLTVGGVMSGAYALTKLGSGTLTLSNANTFGGGFTISAGQVNINNPGAVGTGTLSISGGAIDNTSGSPLTLSNNNSQSWSGNFTFIGSNALNLGTGNITLSGNSNVTVSASTLTTNGAISGAFSLTKAGAGTLNLLGASTYSGGTTVSGGVLVVGNTSGSATGSGSVAISSGGTIEGAGSVGGTLTVSSGGTLIPGTSATPGNLTVGRLALQGGANLDVTLTNAGYSSVTVTNASSGAVSLGNANLVFSSTRTESPEAQFLIINNVGGQAVSGTFTGLAEHAAITSGGIDYLISYLDFALQTNNVAIDDYRVQSAMELTATADMTGAINLAWLPTDLGESGYVIQRAPAAGGSWTTIGTLTASSNYAATAMPYTFTDSPGGSTPPAAGTAYQYQILAYSGSTSNVVFTSNSYQATTVAAGVTAGTPVSISIPLQGSTVYSANLSTGVQYEITASSYFNLASPYSVYADANYDWAGNNPNPSTPTGSLSGQTLTNYGIGINDATLDGNKYPYWGSYNPANNYSIVVTGTGQPLAFNYHDDKYPDNAPVGGSTPALGVTITPLSATSQTVNITNVVAEPSDLIPYNDTGWKYEEYTAPAFPESWMAQHFDDSSFLIGQAGFGSPQYDSGLLNGTDGHATVLDGTATAWNIPTFPSYILLRHSFTLATLNSSLTAYFAVDNGFRVFINGIELTGQVQPGTEGSVSYNDPAGNADSTFHYGDTVQHDNAAQLDSCLVNIPEGDLQTGNNIIALEAINTDDHRQDNPAFVDARVSSVPGISYQIMATDAGGLPLSYAITSSYPSGMMIDPQSGLLTWSPGVGVTGNYPVTVTATDSAGNSASTTFTIAIAPLPTPGQILGSVEAQNSSGVVTPLAGATVYIDAGNLGYESYYDKTVTTDSNGNYTLSALYASTSYTIRVIPPSGYILVQPGSFYKTAAVDSSGDTVTVSPFICTAVPDGYVSPTLNALPSATAVVGHAYSQSVTLNDGLAPFAFSLDPTSAARGISIDGNGRISWTPSVALSPALVTVTAVDSVGVSVSTTYSLQSVVSVPPPSSVSVLPNPTHAFVGQLTSFSCSAQSEIGIAGYTLTATPINGTAGSAFNIPINSSGGGTYNFSNAGQYSLMLTATDSIGGTSTSSAFVLSVSYYSVPTVTIEAPTDGSSETDPSGTTTITAGLSDTYGLVSYSVAVTDLSDVGEGKRSVPGVGRTFEISGSPQSDTISYGLDPTNLSNGTYRVDISAINVNGVSSEAASVFILVSDRLKLGNLRLSFTDLTANVGGFPVTITRTYDSLDSANYGDFGYGWSLSDSSVKITSTAQAQGNQALDEGDKIWISTGDGPREEFIFSLIETGIDEITNLPVYDYSFVPAGGATFTDQLENTGTVYRGIDGNLYDNDVAAAGGTTEEPFSMDLEDGTSVSTEYLVRTAQGSTETLLYTASSSEASLVSVTDARGNELDYSSSAITAYDPNHDVLGSVLINRGGDDNAVSSISFGNTQINYGYGSASGGHAETLGSVTDAAGKTTTFSYGAGGAPQYYLTGITNAAGVAVLSAAFDTNGRLTGLTDANGNAVQLGTDSSPDSFGETSETATDALGYKTVTVYDANGDAVRTVKQRVRSADYTFNSLN